MHRLCESCSCSRRPITPPILLTLVVSAGLHIFFFLFFSLLGDQSGDFPAPPWGPLPFETPPWAEPNHRGQTGAFQIRQQVILLELVRRPRSPRLRHALRPKVARRWHREKFRSLQSRPEHPWMPVFFVLFFVFNILVLLLDGAHVPTASSPTAPPALVQRLRKIKEGWIVWSKVHASIMAFLATSVNVMSEQTRHAVIIVVK